MKGYDNQILSLVRPRIQLPARIWLHLNIAWTLFFIALGIANLYVAYNFDTETWVNFKLFGLLGLTFVLVIAPSLYVARFIEEHPEDKDKDAQ